MNRYRDAKTGKYLSKKEVRRREAMPGVYFGLGVAAVCFSLAYYLSKVQA